MGHAVYTFYMGVARIFRGCAVEDGFCGMTQIMVITPFKAIQGHQFLYQLKARIPVCDFLCISIIATYGLILHVSEIWWIIGPTFAVARRCLCLTQSFLPQALNSVLQIWSSETRNVSLSCGAKHISISRNC